MCIVIDSDVFGAVFNEGNADHNEFAPVKRRIERGKLVVVYGGTAVINEYGYKRHKLLRDLRGRGSAIAINDAAVDAREKAVRQKTEGSGCDDQHFIALLGASRCLLVCTGDKRAHPFYKDPALYPKDMGKVRIYGASSHSHLLTQSDVGTLKNVEQ
jgi:hypothetical protein